MQKSKFKPLTPGEQAFYNKLIFLEPHISHRHCNVQSTLHPMNENDDGNDDLFLENKYPEIPQDRSVFHDSDNSSLHEEENLELSQENLINKFEADKSKNDALKVINDVTDDYLHNDFYEELQILSGYEEEVHQLLEKESKEKSISGENCKPQSTCVETTKLIHNYAKLFETFVLSHTSFAYQTECLHFITKIILKYSSRTSDVFQANKA